MRFLRERALKTLSTISTKTGIMTRSFLSWSMPIFRSNVG